MLIDISGVKIEYSNNNAMSNINLQIQEGVNVIIGKNGVGKSSLLSLLAGLVKIDKRCNVVISGIPVYKQPHKALKEVAFIPEKPFPLVGGIVKDWITTYSMFREVSSERLRHLLNYFDLNYLLRQKSSLLSMGETQLISVILCLSTNAKCFILDEPNANLDRGNRIKLANFINKMKNEMNASFLITSHILDEIISIADSIIIFKTSSISSPKPNDLSKKFLIIKAVDNKKILESIEGKFEFESNEREIKIKDGKIKALISNLEDYIADQIISLNSYSDFMEDEFKDDFDQKPDDH